MLGAAVILGVFTTATIALDVWATVVVRRQIDVAKRQRRYQIAFIWLLPIIGALIALEIHRQTKPDGAPASLAADEIHPMLDQALRPLADAATRTSARIIEQEVIDFGHDHSGHSDSGASH